MSFDGTKAPWPWYGGKSQAAPAVWAALGDVDHYVEPFAGALGVLLNRPHPCNRTYYSETINDLDGFVCNAWRAIQWHPEETAAHASWPVTEADKSARQIACLQWRTEATLDLLAGSPEWCDPKIAGWWLYGVCCQIGAFTGDGPWTADPTTGRIVKQGRPGVLRNRPHLGNNGQGINSPQLREPGVSRGIPHLADDGRGINSPQLREPGVSRGIPHLADDGQGINSPQLREPGVLSDREDSEFHPLTMPGLIRWFQLLAARLRHVRIVNGPWERVCTSGALFTLPVRYGKGGVCGVFLDPPYANEVRSKGLYAHDCGQVASDVREWCRKWGNDRRLRIVLAGFDTEHVELEEHGWTVVEWFRPGFLTGGMGHVGEKGHQQHRERLWCSPHCLGQQRGLFDALMEETP